ncbi:ScbR family autoregulator-binding transcription factor [Streptomyces sp. NPDC054838]
MKQERALRTRQALIKSAATVFGRRGYAEATLNMISAGAGVTPGALHFHFENKAAVAAAVESAAAGCLRTVAHEVYARRTSALQALADSSLALAHALLSDVVARAGFQLGHEALYPTVYDLREEWHAYVRRLLKEADAEDTLLPGLCRRHTAAMVVAATIGFELLGRDDPQWLSPRTLTGFWQVLLPCLADPEALRELDL